MTWNCHAKSLLIFQCMWYVYLFRIRFWSKRDLVFAFRLLFVLWVIPRHQSLISTSEAWIHHGNNWLVKESCCKDILQGSPGAVSRDLKVHLFKGVLQIICSESFSLRDSVVKLLCMRWFCQRRKPWNGTFFHLF